MCARPSLACCTYPFFSRILMVVSTELYARAGLIGSSSRMACTVAGPFCHSTSIRRSSASVNVGDFFGGKVLCSSLPLRDFSLSYLDAGNREIVTNYLVIFERKARRDF